MIRTSGKPVPSPSASCFFAISWKSDQIAPSPSTRVFAPPASETTAFRSLPAKSMSSWPVKRYGMSTALPPRKRCGGPFGWRSLWRDVTPLTRATAARAAAGDDASTNTAMRLPW